MQIANPDFGDLTASNPGEGQLRMIANGTHLGVLLPWEGGYLEDEIEFPFLFDLTGSLLAIYKACGQWWLE